MQSLFIHGLDFVIQSRTVVINAFNCGGFDPYSWAQFIVAELTLRDID
jgi:hypothetical protein